MANFQLRDLEDRKWNEFTTRAKLDGWPVRDLILQLLDDYQAGRIRPSTPAPRPPAPRRDEAVVVLPFTCPKCNRALEVDCRHTSGFGHMGWYAVDCPHCGKITERSLPGDIVSIRTAGKPTDDQIIKFAVTCSNDHQTLMQFRRHELEDLLDEHELKFYCIRCDQSWYPSAVELENLRRLLRDPTFGTRSDGT